MCHSSDYKKEYEKLREEKLGEEKKTSEKRLTQITEKIAIGTEVPMASFVTEISSGRDLSDIYLKHPANESSDDEEGTEQGVEANGDDEREEENFKEFVRDHLVKQDKKIKISQVKENP